MSIPVRTIKGNEVWSYSEEVYINLKDRLSCRMSDFNTRMEDEL